MARERVVTIFVAHPEKLAEAEALYAARVNAIDPALATIIDVDRHATPINDPDELWELRATAVYEGIERIGALQLFQIGSVLDLLGDEDSEDDVLNNLFFCDPAELDPFPATVNRFQASSQHAHVVALPTSGEIEQAPPVVLQEGTWLVTVYALVSQQANPAAEFEELLDGLSVLHRGEIVEDLDKISIFGPLIVRQTQLLLDGASRHEDYPQGRLRLVQRVVVKHAGPVRVLAGNDESPAVFTAERLS